MYAIIHVNFDLVEKLEFFVIKAKTFLIANN